jgi:hypothetical protein
MIAAVSMHASGRGDSTVAVTNGTTEHPMNPQYSQPMTAASAPTSRSTEMYSMHEALAREHMRQREHEARQHALSSRMASANRWRYLERRAHSAYQRHALRAHRAAQASAVAD